MRLLLVALLVLIVVATGYGIFRAVSPPPRRAPSAFQQAPCPFTLGQGLVEGKDVRCGFVVVPEDRSQPKSPTIRLAVAIFKTSSPHPAPDPVLVLGGGPGDALLEKAGPTYTAGNLPSNRDLILLDQRGAGYSQPSLKYGYPSMNAGLNLNAFTTLESAADVHDLIRALGYRQVNLDGVSYGTRLALTLMRLFPADLRSVVLDSVLPPQVNAFTSRPPAAARAFAVLFHGCAAARLTATAMRPIRICKPSSTS
jgi:pimeloyl-ACP methyl ester carboxylesterase